MDQSSILKKSNPLPLACHVCRKKKIKCSGAPAPCTNCVSFKTNCSFPERALRRKTPLRSSRRIDELETRLFRIEELLKQVVNPTKINQSLGPGNVKQSAPSSDLTSTFDTPTGSAVILSSSGVDSSVQRLDKWNHTGDRRGTSSHVDTSNATTTLPSFDEAMELMNLYFNTMNRFLPLFDEFSLTRRMRESYESLESDSALWAAVNIVFAFSLQLSAMQTNEPSPHYDARTNGFLRNAISVVDRLATQAPSMLSAQALIGIAKVYHATSTPQAAVVFVSMATTQIYQLGLHRDYENNGIALEALKWHRRVLWMAYTVDKDYSLVRLEQPHTLNDQDLDQTLPDWNPSDGLGFLTGKVRINYFRLHVNLAIIQSKIYRRLRLKEDSTTPTITLKVCDLVNMLETWKIQIPIVFTPENLLNNFEPPSVVAMVILYLRYFNCMTIVHRLSYWKVGHLEAYKESFEDYFVTPCPSQALCMQAARTSLQLLKVLPQGNVPCIWLLVDYLISAALMLLAGIIYTSPLSLGSQDLLLVDPVVANLEILARHGDTERLEHIRTQCVELQSAAKNILQHSEGGKDSQNNFAVTTFRDDDVLDFLYPSLPLQAPEIDVGIQN